jgi:hypothetical protein
LCYGINCSLNVIQNKTHSEISHMQVNHAYVEIVQHNTENQKSELSRFRPEMEIEHSGIEVRTSLLMLTVLSVCSAVRIWSLKQKPQAVHIFTYFLAYLNK